MSLKMPTKAERNAIGIDLGTTYSCVAIWFDKHNRVEIIPNEQGNKITPSCVAWNETEFLVGEAAKNQISGNPKNTVFGKFVQPKTLAIPLFYYLIYKPMNFMPFLSPISRC